MKESHGTADSSCVHLNLIVMLRRRSELELVTGSSAGSLPAVRPTCTSTDSHVLLSIYDRKQTLRKDRVLDPLPFDTRLPPQTKELEDLFPTGRSRSPHHPLDTADARQPDQVRTAR